MSISEANAQLGELQGWEVLSEPDRLRKSWIVDNFLAAIEFFRRITELAESETHHPDLHLVRYRTVSVEVWTHAIDGLSLNDFILAAKIDALPVRLKISREVKSWFASQECVMSFSASKLRGFMIFQQPFVSKWRL